MNIAALSPRAIADCDEAERQQRFAGAGRAEDQVARAALEPAAEQAVESAIVDRHRLALEARAMLGRDQPREHAHAAGLDDEIVIAAAIAPAAIFEHAHAPPFGAVSRATIPPAGSRACATLCTVLSITSAVRSSSISTVASLREK